MKSRWHPGLLQRLILTAAACRNGSLTHEFVVVERRNKRQDHRLPRANRYSKISYIFALSVEPLLTSSQIVPHCIMPYIGFLKRLEYVDDKTPSS